MISAIGNSYGYYTSSYASGATIGAARTAINNTLYNDWTSVPPVDDVPEVPSNTETERVERTKEEIQQDRKDTYEIMNSLNPRNTKHLNAPLEFMTKSPFNAEIADITKSTKDTEQPENSEECETCERRTYVDGSNENDVSFQTPGHISPKASAFVVSAHEYEHVRNAMQEDKKEDAELVNVSVSLKTAICPECKTSYISGGETRTTMRYGAEQNAYEKQQQAYQNYIAGANGQINLAA